MTNTKIEFKTEITETLVNAVRRYINEIPVVAIDTLDISRNDSAIYDEMIAHRMGLIPIKMKVGVKEAALKLSKKGEATVYSGDISGDLEVSYKEIPLTVLDKNQEIELIANTTIGRGSEHSKFSPGLMFYRNISELKIDKECLEEIKKVFPNLEAKEKGDKVIIIDNKSKEITDVCEGICERMGKKIEIEFKKELFVKVESFGQFECKDVLKNSIKELKKDLAIVSKAISK